MGSIPWIITRYASFGEGYFLACFNLYLNSELFFSLQVARHLITAYPSMLCNRYNWFHWQSSELTDAINVMCFYPLHYFNTIIISSGKDKFLFTLPPKYSPSKQTVISPSEFALISSYFINPSSSSPINKPSSSIQFFQLRVFKLCRYGYFIIIVTIVIADKSICKFHSVWSDCIIYKSARFFVPRYYFFLWLGFCTSGTKNNDR